MVRSKVFSFLLLLLFLPYAPGAFAQGTSQPVKTANGLVAGTVGANGVRSFKGVPFAAPPVGDLRWKAPQPAKNWTGVLQADHFGPRAMQLPLFSDMVFRSDSVSEDCLYLNVWTPAKSANEKLPVLVYFYGGGFMAGDGSELRYDGESMAEKGIVAVTVNYRLGVFGFLAHPALTQESPHHASGNYGLMDQSAALRWVKENIAAFGGDPSHITIAGESAGSYSVSAQMASPLSRDLIAAAIGESGSLLSLQPATPLEQAEQQGQTFAQSLGANSLAQLRAIPAQQLLEATAKPGAPRFSAIVDGYFFPKPPTAIYAAGEQAHVPLLAGWNSQEMSAGFLLGEAAPTPENYKAAVQKLYGDRAADILKVYPASTPEEAEQSATRLASDMFIGFSTWKWIDLHSKTGGSPVYRYYFARPRPVFTAAASAAAPDAKPAKGAVHSAEIEYALGNLATNKVYDWTPEDYKVSQIMQNYFANFIRTFNPNGPGLPMWPPANKGNGTQVMVIDVDTHAQPEQHRESYLLLENIGPAAR